MFQIVGHTYDLDVENKWNIIENTFEVISKQNDILPMTTIEIIDYLKAMNKVEITDEYIQNNSDISLWFSINNIICEIKSNEKFMMY